MILNQQNVLPETQSSTCCDVAHKKVHFVQYQWNIDRFVSGGKNKRKYIDSEWLNTPTDPRYKFYLCLHPNGIDEHSQDYLSLQLGFISNDINEANAQYQLSILDGDGQEWKLFCMS